MTGLQDSCGNREQTAYSEMMTCTDAAECVAKAKGKNPLVAVSSHTNHDQSHSMYTAF